MGDIVSQTNPNPGGIHNLALSNIRTAFSNNQELLGRVSNTSTNFPSKAGSHASENRISFKQVVSLLTCLIVNLVFSI